MRQHSTNKHWWDAGTYPGLVLLLGMLFFQACAPPPPRRVIPPVVRKDPFRNVPALYRLKARQKENARDLPAAIFCWRIVQSFRPEDPEPRAEIRRLSLKAKAEAEKHLALGLEYLRNKKTGAARHHLLMALFYRPGDRKALESLEKALFPPEAITYHVKKGDTNLSIAKKLYHDPQKTFLVAYFAGSRHNGPPVPGEILYLPLIEGPPPVKKPRPLTSIQKARSLFARKKYREAISLAENIVAYGPSKSAREIINGSYYALALQKLKENRLVEARKLFEMVNRDYGKTADYIRNLTNQLRVRADYHYKKGVRYFLDEKLAKAISEWETTLRLNPEHARARADLKKARAMLKNLNGLQ